MSYNSSVSIIQPTTFFNDLNQAPADLPIHIRNELNSAYASYRTNIGALGQALEAAGTAIGARPGATNEIVGGYLGWFGRSLQTGTTVAPEFSLAKFAEAGLSLAVGYSLTAIASNIAQLALTQLFGPLGGAVLVGALFVTHPYVMMVVIGATSLGLAMVLGDSIVSKLKQYVTDPLVLDLDGDGIELISLNDSNAHFDYGADGFAERTGWVKADDGILILDKNANGIVDGIAEMFGSATQDGFEVLETLDTNHDGKIDSADADFAKLRVWQDANEDGISDAGELKTLAELNIASISLTRTDVTGTNEGHDRGFAATFTRTDSTTGAAETIYFQTDRADTVDPTPEFTPAAGVEDLPQLSGSGNIHSIAYKLTNDTSFRAAWTALTDNAPEMSEAEIKSAFAELLLRWAGVENINRASRGEYVDARHLAFLEAFFGDTYREFVDDVHTATSPARKSTGAAIEASFWQVVTVLELAFLAQITQSAIARSSDLEATLTEQITSPYFAFGLLDFRVEIPEEETPPETPGNIGMVVDLIKAMAPVAVGAQTAYVVSALSALQGMVSIAFGGNQAAYAAVVAPRLADIADPDVLKIALEIVNGTAALGTGVNESLKVLA